jgi:hypothetical protein
VEDANDKEAPRPRQIGEYVDAYGKERPGFINYDEFKTIFEAHARPIMFAPKGPTQYDSC